MQTTITIPVTADEANELVADISYINQQSELLAIRRQSLDRLVTGHAKGAGHKAGKIVKAELVPVGAEHALSLIIETPDRPLE